MMHWHVLESSFLQFFLGTCAYKRSIANYHRFVTCASFMRSWIKMFSWWLIGEVDSCKSGPNPETLGKVSIKEHWAEVFNNNSIHDFSKAIFLWGVRGSFLMNDSTVMEETIKFERSVFTTTIRVKDLDSQTSLVLNHDFKLLESSWSFTFVLQEMNPDMSTVIINEGNKVMFSSNTRGECVRGCTLWDNLLWT